MAINETHAGRTDTLRQVEVVTETMRRPVLPAIRWGAVLAGVAVGISIQLVLSLLGIATGLSTLDVAQGDRVGMGPLIWAGISMLISAFVGGYVAARMSGLKRKADGVLHGAVSWAVTTILFALLATSIGSSLVGNVFSNMSQLAQASASRGGPSPLSVLMRAQGINANPQVLSQLQQYLRTGQRDQATQLMTGTMGVQPDRAQQIVDQALILSGSPEAASQQGKSAAQNTVQNAGMAAWVVFLAVALALAVGIVGGMLGAAGSRRVTWTNAAPVPRP